MWREVRAENENTQFNFRPIGELAQRPVEVAVVGARGGDHADPAARGSESALREKSVAVRWILRRNHTRSIYGGCFEVRLRSTRLLR